MSEVIRVLRQDHTNLAKLLDLLEGQVAIFNEAGVPDYDIVNGVLTYCLTYPDQCHHPKEDLVLIKLQARDAQAAEEVGDLEAEHERLAAQTRRIAALVSQILLEAEVPREQFGEAAQDFLRSYRQHMKQEEEVFFPAALGALKSEDWAEILTQLADISDPMFGVRPEKRFQTLRDNILSWDRSDRHDNVAPPASCPSN